MNSKLYKTCRICLKTDNQLISFDSIMNYVPIKKMVTKILKYKYSVNENALFPNKICRSCLDNIEMCYNFTKVFAKSTKKLQKLFLERPDQFEMNKPEHGAGDNITDQENTNTRVEEEENEPLIILYEEQLLKKKKYADKSLQTEEEEQQTANAPQIDGGSNVNNNNNDIITTSINASKIQCICGLRFMSNAKLDYHILKHAYPFHCYTCDASSAATGLQSEVTNVIDLFKHTKTHKLQNSEKQLSKPENADVPSSSKFTETVRTFPCNTFSKNSNSSESTEKQLKIPKTTVKIDAMCEISESEFENDNKPSHINRQYKNEASGFSCKICKREFISAMHLKNHIRLRVCERKQSKSGKTVKCFSPYSGRSNNILPLGSLNSKNVPQKNILPSKVYKAPALPKKSCYGVDPKKGIKQTHRPAKNSTDRCDNCCKKKKQQDEDTCFYMDCSDPSSTSTLKEGS